MPPERRLGMIRQENAEGICLGALESKVKLSFYGALTAQAVGPCPRWVSQGPLLILMEGLFRVKSGRKTG